MQHQDLLNLFQRAPLNQQSDISQPGPERDAQQPQAPPEAQVGGSKDIESLFRNLAPNPPAASTSIVNSPPESTISLSSATSGNTDRQAALLSLLGTVGVPSPTPPTAPQQSGANNQPSAPNQQQGKLLLEQLVGGPTSSIPAPATQSQAPAPSSQPFPLSQQPQFQSQSQAPSSMPTSHSQPPPATHGQPMNLGALTSGHISEHEAAENQRKALFDYVSPYDAFPAPPSQFTSTQQPGNSSTNAQPSAPPATTAVVSPPKKKPVPVYNPSPAPASAPGSPHITSQQSFQRRHTPSPEPPQYNMYQQGHVDISEREGYSDNQYNAPQRQGSVSNNEPAEDTRSNASQPIGIQHGPLPPIPNNQRASPQYQQRPLQQQGQVQVQEPLASPPTRPAHPNPNQSHRQSPPPTQRQHEFTQQQAQAPRGRGSPASLRQGGQQAARDGAGSPSGNSNGSAVNGKRTSKQTYGQQQAQAPQQQQSQQRGTPSPSQHSLITIDVTAPLVSTLAAPDAVSITPIALLKLEPTYTPGTTIGVANFIAYSMSRGRIRLIGRQTGERALLKLPATFPSNAQVQDMVISGTKLACVSNDGGLVVWDIPGDIEDDAAAVSRIILHVPPQPNAPGFRVVKWHPKQAGMLAVASEKEIYLLNIDEAYQVFGSEGVSQEELSRVSKVFSIPSPLVSFTFDVPQIALASISIDSTITLWSIKDKMPFWSGRVHGEGYPSSIDFLDGGLVVGRNQGNVIQLLPVMSTTVLSTIKFVFASSGGAPQGSNGPKAAVESQELMFGHLCYDSASKILWVANSARNSLFAVKMGVDETPVPPTQTQTAEPTSPTMRPAFDQIVEFPCSMPTINLTVVPAEALEEGGSNWTRDPSLAVSAFCVHAGGVDQINIAQDAYDDSSAKTASKLPNVAYGALALGPDRRGSGQSQTSVGPQAQQQQPLPPQQQRPEPYNAQSASYAGPSQQQIPANMPAYGNQPEPMGSYEPTAAPIAAPSTTQAQAGVKKGKDISSGKQQSSWKASPSGSAAESVGPKADTRDNDALAAGLTKEIRKVEENLSTRIGRLISKELDKQQKNLEDVRHADQTADFERQEKILKLISTELTKNTTRVVETAVKNVIQNSVLPALETVTRREVKVALDTQISKGLSDSMKQTLPVEIEKLLLRPDVSNNVARTFSSAITPLIERNVKEMINKSLVPAYTEATSAMQQEIVQEVMGQVGQIKKEIATWQNESIKGTHNLIRDMDQTIRGLTEQVRTLAMQVQAVSSARSATPRTETTAVEYPQHLRQAPTTSAPPTSSFMGYTPQQQNSWGHPPMNSQPVQSPLGPLLPPPTMAPVPPAPAQSLPPAPQRVESTPQRSEDWDSTFLNTLGQNDHKQIRELLSRTPPDSVFPVGQVSPLSQTVILALIHRLALSLTELSPADDAFKTTLWWLQRCAYSLNPNDNVIAPYIGRVLQTAQNTLNTTVQRLNVLPGGPSPAETSSMVGQIQQTLSNLMT
ncbi:hypothetical protein FRB94_007090 [Tulasnella sp. JGI-2019a]|nr:hypothetical protein FRB94_007090 [Tulasnella sp. JGI-2019a]